MKLKRELGEVALEELRSGQERRKIFWKYWKFPAESKADRTDARPRKEPHMKTWLRGYFLLAGILIACLPMSAHHGNAAFSDKITEFKNVTVTKFAWANPHCLVEFDAKDASGKVVNWSAESGSPEALRLTGWNKASLKPGDVITIYVHTAKTGAPAGRLTKVVLADGTTLGDTQGNAAPPISGGRGARGGGEY